MEATKFLVLNINIQGSFKKCSLLFSQTKMIFSVVSLLDHFSLKSTPSVNGALIIPFVSHLHVWVRNVTFVKLPVLT